MLLKRPGPYLLKIGSSEPMRLYTVGEGVTDELRRIMATPTLAEAKAQEADFAKK
jgi:hypothetical protein